MNEIKIYEFDKNNPYGLYIVGTDPFRVENNNSLGIIQIYPRKDSNIENAKIITVYKGNTLNN